MLKNSVIALLAICLLISLYYNFISSVGEGHCEDNLYLINEDLAKVSGELRKEGVSISAFSELIPKDSENPNSVRLQVLNIYFDENGIIESIHHGKGLTNQEN